LELLCKAIRAPHRKDLLSATKTQLEALDYEFLDEAWSEETQWQLYQRNPWSGMGRMYQGVALPVDEDFDMTESSPPLAWRIISQDKYSNTFGEFVPDIAHRWGYVFWNASRIERTQAREMLSSCRGHGLRITLCRLHGE
jgi:hypothetical protein